VQEEVPTSTRCPNIISTENL